MLSGHPPFGARDMRKILHAIINEPPVALSDDEAPEALRRVLNRGLAKAPDERYQQCADMRADIEQVRRTIAASTARVMDAARDRYRQLTSLIEERRACGRGLGDRGHRRLVRRGAEPHRVALSGVCRCRFGRCSTGRPRMRRSSRCRASTTPNGRRLRRCRTGFSTAPRPPGIRSRRSGADF